MIKRSLKKKNHMIMFVNLIKISSDYLGNLGIFIYLYLKKILIQERNQDDRIPPLNNE